MNLLKKFLLNRTTLTCCFLMALTIANAHASLFNIVPKAGTTLPTESGTKAYYTVTNTTGSTKTNIYVRYLPPNVTQVFNSTAPGICGQSFTLAPSASCTLELNVNGPVNANDPNPRHHLFVCLAGCIPCCAGTLFPLSVGDTAAPTVLSIAITPITVTLPIGATQQYIATAFLSNGTSRDITSSVTWSSSNASIASIDNNGLLTANANGPFSVTATYTDASGTFSATGTGTVLSVVSLTISPPNITLPIAATQQYTAIATLSDGSTSDVTASTVWSSSSPATAGIDANGLLTANMNGPFTITGSYTNISGTFFDNATGTVVSVVSLAVTPANATLTVGETQQYTAIATLSDGSTIDVTTSSTWSSSHPTIGSIDSNTGLLTANASGSYTVTATYVNISGSFSGTANGMVNVTLVSLTVTPSTVTIPVGAQQTYTAIATYSDASTADVTSSTTWTTSNPAIASIDPTGLLTGNSPGTFTVTGTYLTVTDTTNASVVREQTLYATLTATSDSTAQCTVNYINGTISGCSTSPLPGNPEGIILVANATLAYVTTADSPTIIGQIFLCVVDPITGNVGSCQDAGAPIMGFYQGLTINQAGTVLYVSNFANGGPPLFAAMTCNIDPITHLLSGCNIYNPPSTSLSTGIVLSPEGSYAYISNFGNSSVTVCAVSSLDGTLNSCVDSGATSLLSPDGLGINGNYVYISSQFYVQKCTRNAISGFLSGCVDSGAGNIFTNAQNIAFTADGLFAYIPKRSDNSITLCNVNASTGNFSGCTTTPGFDSPTSVAVK